MSFTPGYEAFSGANSEKESLRCAEEAMIAHHLIHEAQKQFGEFQGIHGSEVGVEEGCEHDASTIELAYALRFCQASDLEREQKSMALALNHGNSEAFKIFVEARLPEFETYETLLDLDFSNGEDIEKTYPALEQAVYRILQSAQEMKDRGTMISTKWAYRLLQSARFGVPPLRQEAERNLKPLFFSRSSRDYETVQALRETRQKLNRWMLEIQTLQEQTWVQMESQDLQQLTKN